LSFTKQRVPVAVASLALGASILAGCGSLGAPPSLFQLPVVPQVQPQAAAQSVAVQESGSVASVYERVSAGVVNITVSGSALSAFGRSLQQEATGSGFIIDNQGHIVTNQHVVANASRLDVTLADGSMYAAQVVVTDPATDLAVVKLEAPAEVLRQLTIVPLGDSDQLKVGESVVAIGSPFGLERSATLGIVSSLGRSRPGTAERLISDMIQTDAAINPGNSGGPLLNMRGEVVGINEQIESSTMGNVGVGFAVPVNTLKRHLDTMLAGRQPEHAWLGIGGTPLTPTMAERLNTSVTQGVLLTAVVPNGPAAGAGLRGASTTATSGDILTAIAGQPVRSVADVAEAIEQRSPNERVTVTYVRAGQTQTADVTLGTWRPTSTAAR
jgi:putative serine protease PepD